jgi:toxin ParE1/3/4
MTAKAVLRREQAQSDVEQAADYYYQQGGVDLELRFLEAVEAAIVSIAQHPGIGSPRYAELLRFPGLRFFLVKGFPHLIFYVEREDHVDVWRVLHGQRDIPAWLGDRSA